MINNDDMDRALKNFEFLALQFQTFFENKITTIPRRKFFIRRLIWCYDRLFALIFSKYFVFFLKENEKNISEISNELQFDGEEMPFSMQKVKDFNENILIIQNFWTKVRDSLFTENYKDFMLFGNGEENRDLENLGLSDKLSVLLYEQEPIFRKESEGLNLFKKEISDLLVNLDHEIEETRKLYFLRKEFLNNFFHMNNDINSEISFLSFLLTIDQRILLNLADFIIFSENFNLLTLRLNSYFFNETSEPAFEILESSLAKLKLAIDYFESEKH